jgi:hypothetical protein
MSNYDRKMARLRERAEREAATAARLRKRAEREAATAARLRKRAEREARLETNKSERPSYAHCPHKRIRHESDIAIRLLLLKWGSIIAAARNYGVSTRTLQSEMTRRGITLSSVLDWTEE